MNTKKKKTFTLILENCQVIEFDAKDVYARFDIAGLTIWGERKYYDVKNVIIHISKEAKAVMPSFEDEDWKERIKIPDITHICFDGEDYSIADYEGEWENQLQRLSEDEDSFFISISKEPE